MGRIKLESEMQIKVMKKYSVVIDHGRWGSENGHKHVYKSWKNCRESSATVAAAIIQISCVSDLPRFLKKRQLRWKLKRSVSNNLNLLALRAIIALFISCSVFVPKNGEWRGSSSCVARYKKWRWLGEMIRNKRISRSSDHRLLSGTGFFFTRKGQIYFWFRLR